MITGNGLVANTFVAYKHNPQVMIFASGVSDSGSTRLADFERESQLLSQTIEASKNVLFVYFSSCSIYDTQLTQADYVRHKMNMENLVVKHCNDYIIFRVSNLAGNTKNPHTMLNYLFHHIQKQMHFYVWKNAERNIIDAADALTICSRAIESKHYHNRILNIAHPANMPVFDIVKTIESFTGKKADYTIADKGGSPQIDLTDTLPLMQNCFTLTTTAYLNLLLVKYYSARLHDI